MNADPGRATALRICALRGISPPTRPLTFSAPEQEGPPEQFYRTNTGRYGTQYSRDGQGRWWVYMDDGKRREPCDDPGAGIFSPAGLAQGAARGELVPVGAVPSPEWVTYAIPVDAWAADMTRAQAGTYGQGDLAPRDVTGYEAICRACGEIFNPDLSYADRSGLEHYQRADQQTPCGGLGDITGWWG